MIPEPLHPAVVHFPIVLAALLPIVTIAALLALRSGTRVRRAWAPVIALAAAVLATGWIAQRTGESDEEAVEAVVPESAIERHESAAELFVPLAAAGLIVISSGLLPGRAGRLGRLAGLVASIALAGAVYRVGHTGGQLVYEHGAAAAYVAGPTGAATDDGGDPDETREESAREGRDERR